ncbi:unnamed protein product [Rotaria sp. Silwood2]|nr:unnamed protein product [Rotaria sp. Silwood2]CAF3022530.1 unnamed protein product [Rotaria sp. Silwood2]CAF3378885.1 unnamed protein product [Rotaria sp. Silwood2]CAF4036411.1 unnamed protein product [Rotaria sp. Silwood2]CAF4252110.1 unnamed protein product [Rotaria sp. Silwood2]
MLFGNRKIWTIGSSAVVVVFIGVVILIANLTVIFKQRQYLFHMNNIRSNFKISINEQNNLSDSYKPSQISASSSQTDLRSLVTTVKCVGPLYNQSCLYKNLYYTNRGFWALSLKENNLSLPGVRLEALATTDFRPNHRVFDTYEELHEFVRLTIDPMVLSGLTLHFNQRWHKNIGHALFDGLYPAYVALIRFAPKHLQSFRVFVGLDHINCDSCFSEDVYSRFAGGGLIKSNVIDWLMPNRWFLFEELVMGSGMMCQRCIQSNYQLAGGVELDGSRLFRDRMYKQHGVIPADARRNYSAEKRNAAKPLNAFIIDNKRFTVEERGEIRIAMDEINNYTDTHINKSVDDIKKLPYPLIRVYYLNYRNIKAKTNVSFRIKSTPVDTRSPTYELMDNDFIAQLQILRDMDIHVTGPGTGQMYQTFLSDGSININLGGMNPYKKETTPIAYPSFLEQYVTAGTPYIKGLYYPINKRRDGIRRIELVKLIKQAAQFIMQGFSLPVNPKDSLAPDGQVFVEQCENDKNFCKLVTVRKTGYFWCNNMWTEDLVHERRQWAEGGFPIGGKKVSCSFNRTLLRNLRQKYGIEYRPGRE